MCQNESQTGIAQGRFFRAITKGKTDSKVGEDLMGETIAKNRCV
jgi:hypothetical protein